VGNADLAPGWRSLRLRHVARVNPRVPIARLAVGDPATFLPLECVWPNPRLDVGRTRIVGEVGSGYTRFMEGDVLVPKITPTFEAARSAVATGIKGGGPGFGTTELNVLRAGPDIDPRYLWYWTLSADFLEKGTAAMVGVAGQRRVPTNFIKDFPILLPPREEQRRIVDFLDAEVARLDAFKRERTTGAEKIKRMVDARVLRRLIPGSADWKSGETLADVRLTTDQPGWSEIRHKYCYLGFQVGAWGEDSDGGCDDTRCVRVADFDYAAGRVARVPTTRLVPRKQRMKRLLRRGDLLLEKSGGGERQPVGRVVLVDREFDEATVCSNFIARMRPRQEFDSHYLQLLNRALYSSGVANLSVKQTTGIQNLDSNHYLSHRVSIPPLKQQIRIREELNELIASERVLAADVLALADLIDERKRALITAAVKGTVDPTSPSMPAAR
jgi:type I restriction enzyme, S subunit